MRLRPMFVRNLSVIGAILATAPVHASEGAGETVTIVRHTGASGLWVLANFCYAGMRAQNHRSFGWRVASFIFGFPGTLLSFLVIREGSGRAYGVDIPKRGE